MPAYYTWSALEAQTFKPFLSNAQGAPSATVNAFVAEGEARKLLDQATSWLRPRLVLPLTPLDNGADAAGPTSPGELGRCRLFW
jgi:hypothetical protein